MMVTVDPLAPIRLKALPFAPPASESDTAPAYFLLVASVGFEQRASFIASRMVSNAAHIVAFTFADQRVLSFQRNLRWFKGHGEVVDVPEDHFRERLVAEIRGAGQAWRAFRAEDHSKPASPLRMAVDISSMTRQRLADAFLAIYLDSGVPVDVDWLYAPATYPGSGDGNPVIRVNRPLRGFEGWGDPDSSLSCVLGAGFEGELALGVLDDLEPANTWVFVPNGYSARHDKELLKRNAPVLGAANKHQVVSYRLDRPLETLLTLEGIVESLILPGRVVLIPMGPKLFALLSMIIGVSNRTGVSVWRISADSAREATERRPAGDIVGIRVVLDGA